MQLPDTILFKRGNVLYGKIFDGIDHSKFFVVLGEDKHHNLLGFFFINTEREIFRRTKKLLYPLKSGDYSFLTHLSFIDCSEIKKINISFIKDKIDKNLVSMKGELSEPDLITLLDMVNDSEVFSKEEKRIYFEE